ncbi:MAG: 16S rRNA (guanine(966)-N(2))-methyltransferase RsmD [Clostridia bacterium]|nr:16S rRNA (guanine(966)-N(2))-methyltransferase RsmD [Clostridia bacterium]
MRIIAGEFKGRKLEAPVDNRIRPTTDKVKEAMFSMLMPYIDDAVCLDLFAGTGNLGLEALSRGAAKCYFSDNSKSSLSLLKTNISKCKMDEYSLVLPGDYERNLARISEKLDIVLIDPPYMDGLYDNCFKLLREYDLLKEEGVIVCEHSEKVDMADEVFGFKKIKEKKYGSIILSIYVD